MGRKCEVHSSWGALGRPGEWSGRGESVWGCGERKSEAPATTFTTHGADTLCSRNCSLGPGSLVLSWGL